MPERKAPCMWGNGECPKNCRLYEDSVKMADEQKLNDDPDALRKVALTAVINRAIPIDFVARAMDKCAKERKS